MVRAQPPERPRARARRDARRAGRARPDRVRAAAERQADDRHRAADGLRARRRARLRRRRGRRARVEPVLRPGSVDPVADGRLGRRGAVRRGARPARRPRARPPARSRVACAVAGLALRRGDEPARCGSPTRATTRSPSSARIRHVAAVRRRPRARQRRVLPRLRARRSCARCGATACASRSRGGRRPRPPAVAVALLALVAAARRRARDAAVPAAVGRYLERAQNADGGLGPAPGRGLDADAHRLGGARARRRRAATRATSSAAGASMRRLHARATRRALRGRPRRAHAHDPRAARRRACSPTRAGGRDLLGELLRRAGGRRLVRRPRQHDRVRDPRAARGRPLGARPRGARRRGVHRRPGQRRRRVQLRRQAAARPAPTTPARRCRRSRRPAGAARAVVRRAAGWLERAQNPDGGFALQGGAEQRAVDRLGGAGADRGRTRPGARAPRRLALAARLPALARRPDGAIRYSRTSTQTPVWVTAQALTALAGKAFPLRPAPRARPDASGGRRRGAGRDAARRRDAAAGHAARASASGKRGRDGAACRARNAAAGPPRPRCRRGRCSCRPTPWARATSPRCSPSTWLPVNETTSHMSTPSSGRSRSAQTSRWSDVGKPPTGPPQFGRRRR